MLVRVARLLQVATSQGLLRMRRRATERDIVEHMRELAWVFLGHYFTSPYPCGVVGLVKMRGILAAPEHPFSLLLPPSWKFVAAPATCWPASAAPQDPPSSL